MRHQSQLDQPSGAHGLARRRYTAADLDPGVLDALLRLLGPAAVALAIATP
jgi:hypothetical protein